MGGIGSTRWKQHQARPIAEQSLAIVLNPQLRQLLRASEDTEQRSRQIIWYRGSQKIASGHVGVERAANGDPLMRLDYSAHGETIKVRIPVELVRQPLGGHRAWWQCPRCGRRCGVLYHLRAASWSCRICAGITYLSSNTSDLRVTELLRHDDLAAGMAALCGGTTLSHLILHQKIATIMRRRANREARRWFRHTHPGRHLPRVLRYGDDSA